MNIIDIIYGDATANGILSEAMDFLNKSRTEVSNCNIDEARRYSDSYATKMVELEHYCMGITDMPRAELRETLCAITLR